MNLLEKVRTWKGADIFTALKHRLASTLLVCILGVFIACGGDEVALPNPNITSLSPESGPPGTVVELIGTNLGNAGQPEITLSEQAPENVTSKTAGTSFTFAIPSSFKPGDYMVKVKLGGRESNKKMFKVLTATNGSGDSDLGPKITVSSPTNNAVSTSSSVTMAGSISGSVSATYSVDASPEQVLNLKSDNFSITRIFFNQSHNIRISAKNKEGQESRKTIYFSVPKPTKMSINYGRSLIVKSDNSLWAFGSNFSGQFCDKGLQDSLVPKQIEVGFLDISAGNTHTLVKKKDNSLWGCGYGDFGQRGNAGNELEPNKIWGQASDFSAGDGYSFGVKADKTLWAWGKNFESQLGDGTKDTTSIPKYILDNVSRISAGSDHVIALKSDGTLWEWGRNYFFDSETPSIPKQVDFNNNFIDISQGFQFSLALKTDGTLWAWGSNSNGNVGDGSGDPIYYPKMILTEVWKMSAASYHAIALKKDGTVWVWGSNSYGQLGDGTKDERSTPKQILKDFKVTDISAGGFHSLALTADGKLLSWGQNSDGQLGDGSRTSSSVPVQVSEPLQP